MLFFRAKHLPQLSQAHYLSDGETTAVHADEAVEIIRLALSANKVVLWRWLQVAAILVTHTRSVRGELLQKYPGWNHPEHVPVSGGDCRLSEVVCTVGIKADWKAENCIKVVHCCCLIAIHHHLSMQQYNVVVPDHKVVLLLVARLLAPDRNLNEIIN